jgi:hypothetical protein
MRIFPALLPPLSAVLRQFAARYRQTVVPTVLRWHASSADGYAPTRKSEKMRAGFPVVAAAFAAVVLGAELVTAQVVELSVEGAVHVPQDSTDAQGAANAEASVPLPHSASGVRGGSLSVSATGPRRLAALTMTIPPAGSLDPIFGTVSDLANPAAYKVMQ